MSENKEYLDPLVKYLLYGSFSFFLHVLRNPNDVIGRRISGETNPNVLHPADSSTHCGI